MSLYPSLEDMTVAKMAKAQAAASHQHAPVAAPPPGHQTTTAVVAAGGLYPSLEDYMGLDLSGYNAPPVPAQGGAVVAVRPGAVVAPSSGPVTGVRNVGIQRAQIKQGVREMVLCKDEKGKCGLSIHSQSKGVFVCFVLRNSPAAMAGLRFGDQVLMINGESVAGYSDDKVHKIIKKAGPNNITLAVRDRPFERTITLQKDSHNHVGFAFKDGEINELVKDSSAARNGVLTDHFLTEVNGQNVIGLKDKHIGDIFRESPRTVTITIMPKFVYKHMMENMGSKLKKSMDHSIPDV